MCQAHQFHKIKVYVAMSGGVDSAVAAALLKKRGWAVTGVFFNPWQPPHGLRLGGCLWQQDRQDAMRIAAILDIPLKTWDFSREYKKLVGDYMVESYRRGLTPNPDVRCNKEIKFGLFLKKALSEGADYIATGHYVRKFQIPNSKFQINSKSQIPNYKLLKGIDRNKDQSYFLWTLTQEQLKYCLFPIGDYLKPEARRIAKKFRLPVHDKKDSQGVCFIGQLGMKEFLKNYIKPKKGTIVRLEGGEEIGEHDGVFYYTIGQRHGLNISNGHGPYFVAEKDTKKNIIFVTNDARSDFLHTAQVKVSKINWINKPPKLPLLARVSIRYRSRPVSAIIKKGFKKDELIIDFQKPAKAVTSGQSAVFYCGEEMRGGGVIV